MEGWKTVKLGELAEFINGYAFKPVDWSKSGLPIIRIEQLKRPETINDFYKGELPKKNIINNGDLIFAWSASLFLKIWRHGKAALNQHLFKVEPKEGVNKVFLKYLIEKNLDLLIGKAHGSTMQHITRKDLLPFKVKMPTSFEEQTQIAQILSTLDSAIQQTESLIQKYQAIKTGLMQDLLTKGIDEQGRIRSEETHEFWDSPIGRIPREWECVKVKEVVESSAYGPRFSSSLYHESGNVAILRTTDLDKEGNINLETMPLALLNLEQYESHILQKNDFLITRSGTIGICSVFSGFELPVLIGAFSIRFRFKKELSPYFLKYYFNWEVGRRRILDLSQGGVLKNLKGSAVLKMYIPLLGEKEQNQVLELLNANNRIVKKMLLKLKKLQLTKTALMQDLLSGDKRVTSLLKKELHDIIQ